MRIGIVSKTCSPEINGVALTVAGLARGLADAGHATQLIRPRQACDRRAIGAAESDAADLARTDT